MHRRPLYVSGVRDFTRGDVRLPRSLGNERLRHAEERHGHRPAEPGHGQIQCVGAAVKAALEPQPEVLLPHYKGAIAALEAVAVQRREPWAAEEEVAVQEPVILPDDVQVERKTGRGDTQETPVGLPCRGGATVDRPELGMRHRRTVVHEAAYRVTIV
jgi:hypothetical protein